jgi:hypothetical protein
VSDPKPAASDDLFTDDDVTAAAAALVTLVKEASVPHPNTTPWDGRIGAYGAPNERDLARAVLAAVAPSIAARAVEAEKERPDHDYCAWCGWWRERDDSDTDALRQHIAECPEHPLRFGSDSRDAAIAAHALRQAADDMDHFRAEGYGPDLFRRPTKEDYAAINALLFEHRGHRLDGISADCYDRAIKVQAQRLRARADGMEKPSSSRRG